MNWWRGLKRTICGELIPTDKELFEFIYKEYYLEFMNYDEENNRTRITKNFVPIDILKIAKYFGVDEDIIFSRFYYVHKKKYDYKIEKKPEVYFFKKRFKPDDKDKEDFEDEMHVIHFPYLSSILAKLKYEEEKFYISLFISIIAVLISFGSLLALLLTKSS